MKYSLKEHIEYLKDNPEEYWFKRKLYGIGWTPATREGWVVALLFMLLIIGNAVRAEMTAVSDAEAVKHIVLPTVALIVLLIVICFKKGEPLKWQFGPPKRKDMSDVDRK